jgi:methylated-DNA-protein-cysteine methyltransferase-like protein
MNVCHDVQPPVPAHRVVNRLGILSGKAHFASPEAMENLLRAEGVEILGDCVQSFDTVFWDPERELGLD